MEDIERDIEALEEEKEEYLEKHPNEDSEGSEEEYESEETEFSLNEAEIDEWINELTRLKEEKGSIKFEIDDENTLKINYSEEDSEEMGENNA
jgi:hypothetical protein